MEELEERTEDEGRWRARGQRLAAHGSQPRFSAGH